MGKISSYTEVSSNTTDDVFICNQTEGGNQVTKKTTLQKIADAIFGAKTDNNLPHYTGTPTAGSTAEAIGNIKEEGSGYIKFGDGTLICYGNILTGAGTYSAYGSLYYQNCAVDVSFAQAFNAMPFVTVTNRDSNAQFVMHTICSSTKITELALIRQNATGTDANFAYIAIGKWK